jgi:hypothetical protein
MDEARRFLRYVIPGLSFIVQAMLLLWELKPGWTVELVAGLSSDKGIGILIATLLGSGGLGFVFSIFHHSLLWRGHWRWITGPMDYRDLIERLRRRNLLRLLDAQSGDVLNSDRAPDRFVAWAIVTALWHERVMTSEEEEDNMIKSAEPRADSLTNLVHSMGTARIASLSAVLLAVIIGCIFTCSIESWRFIIFIATAAVLLISHQSGYWRTGLVTQRVVEQVLTDALANEASSVPVETNVVL